MSPIQTVAWVGIFFFLGLMTQFAFAQAADEPLVAVTTQLPASKAKECAKEGCLILTEQEVEQLVQEALAQHNPSTCRSGPEI